MKKLFLFVYLVGVVGCIGYSQSLSLSNENGPVANNAYVDVLGYPTDDEIVVEMNVTNNTADTLPVMLKKVELSMVPGTSSMFCWGLCYSPSVYVSPDPLKIGGNSTNTGDFSGHYLPSGYSGMSVIRYVFYDERNPSDSVCFNTNFHAYGVGFEEQPAANTLSAYPNPANGNVTITYSGPEAGTLVIRNVLGTTVKEIATGKASGKVTVSVSDLASGIYFYSFVANDKVISTKKLVVK